MSTAMSAAAAFPIPDTIPPLWRWFDLRESDLRLAWDTRPTVFRAAGRAHVDLLTLSDIAILLNQNLRFPSVRVILNGERIMPQPLEGTVRAWDAIEAFTRDATIGLNALELTWEPVARMCDEIQATYPLAQVDANAVYSPPRPQGMPPHEDPMAVLVLQVEGSKHWRFGQVRRSRDLTEEVELHRGDMLLMPRGFYHYVDARTRDSVHLIFQFARTDLYDAYRRALDQAEAAVLVDPWYAAPLGPDELPDLVTRLVADADLSGAAAAHERRFRSTRSGLRPGGARTGGLLPLLARLGSNR